VVSIANADHIEMKKSSDASHGKLFMIIIGGAVLVLMAVVSLVVIIFWNLLKKRERTAAKERERMARQFEMIQPPMATPSPVVEALSSSRSIPVATAVEVPWRIKHEEASAVPPIAHGVTLELTTAGNLWSRCTSSNSTIAQPAYLLDAGGTDPDDKHIWG
jgi:hypothetical protein